MWICSCTSVPCVLWVVLLEYENTWCYWNKLHAFTLHLTLVFHTFVLHTFPLCMQSWRSLSQRHVIRSSRVNPAKNFTVKITQNCYAWQYHNVEVNVNRSLQTLRHLPLLVSPVLFLHCCFNFCSTFFKINITLYLCKTYHIFTPLS